MDLMLLVLIFISGKDLAEFEQGLLRFLSAFRV